MENFHLNKESRSFVAIRINAFSCMLRILFTVNGPNCENWCLNCSRLKVSLMISVLGICQSVIIRISNIEWREFAGDNMTGQNIVITRTEKN